MTRERAEIAGQANSLLQAVSDRTRGRARVSVAETMSQIGSGALPVETLPSAALVLTPDGDRAGQPRSAGGRCRRLAEALRSLPVPIIGRIKDDTILLDLRTLEDEAGFLNSLSAL